MAAIIKNFNTIVEDLLKQTTCLIGTKYLFNFKKLIQFNSSLPIQQFTKSMIPYKIHIMNRDTDFFINSNIDLNNYNDINYNDIINLKQIFLNIDDESKNNIWDTLQALIILCEDRLQYVTNKNANSYW